MMPRLLIANDDPHRYLDTVSFAQFFLTNLGRWMKGESLLNTVDPRKGY